MKDNGENMSYLEEYKNWCTNPIFDENTRRELLELKGNDKEIEDRFYKGLEFGTAGMRGVIGAGTNRMNIYTVGKATQGVANYLIGKGLQDKGVIISYDCRIMSKEFSEYASLCLNANGIKTYIFDELKPIPELSFTIRDMKAGAGIMITASHNPPEYNGYKVLLEDGAQFTDDTVAEEVSKVIDYNMIKTISKEDAVNNGLYKVIGKEADDNYLEEIKKLILNPEIVREMGKTLKIVYTPLNGAGKVLVERLLSDIGFENVYIVKEQEMPDGNFPTLDYPNPEDPKAFTLALKLAKEVDADVVLATDPDADRLGIYVKDTKTNEYILFNGNMMASLVLEYILTQKAEKEILPKKGSIIKSIVSTTLTEKMAEYYGQTVFPVLTGFKNMGAKIKEQEKKGEYEFVFAYEESYGCLPGSYARDKDAVATVMVICEAAAYYKKQGLTLWDEMLKMYEKYGYYKEDNLSLTLKGSDGAEQIKEIMRRTRDNPLITIGNNKILAIKDYDTNEIIDLVTGGKSETGLPKSNVLYYVLENNEWFCIRPSGTEPKIKSYVGVVGKSLEDAENRSNELRKEVAKLFEI